MKYKSGFTLLEILLYLVIGSITLSIAAFSFIQISRLGASFRVTNELNQASEMITSQIQDTVKNADTIISPLIGSAAATITLNINNSIYTIQETGNNITVTNSGNTITLNPESVRISNTSFEVINNENTSEQGSLEQSFKFKFTITYIQPTITSFEYNITKNIETVIRLPKTKTSFSPILNDYPIDTNGAAYSLRKLSGTTINPLNYGIGQYTGPAIRVRRDRGADQAESDINFTSNGRLDTVSLQSFIGYQNFLTQSEDITTTGSWVLNNVTSISNNAIAPNGTTTAEKITLNTGNQQRFINKDTVLTNGSIYTDSYYVKANNGYNFVQIATSNGFTIGPYQNYNLSNGTLGSASGIIAGQSSITSVGNGWYRISLSATATASGSGRMVLAIANSATSARVETVNVASATDSIFVWGAQRHLNTSLTASPKSYQKTDADANTGNGYITQWYDQSKNNRHLSQSTLSAQPKIVDAVNGIIYQNGSIAIQFDGNDELISTTSATFNYGFLIGSRALATQSYIHRDGSLNDRGFSFSNSGDSFDIFDNYYLNRNTVDTITVDTKNTLNSYMGTILTPPAGTFSIGKGTGPEFTYLNGTISEILLYGNDQSTNQDAIRLDLNTYYNIP